MVANVLAQVKTKMSNGSRRAGFFAAIGTLVAVLIIAGIAVGGIHFPSIRLPGMISDKSRLIIKIMDKPVNLTHLNVTIDGLWIQGGGGNWTELELLGGVEQIYFDLLALQNVTMTLSNTEISPGNYTMIKMHVLKANATYADGDHVDLRVPSEHIKVLLRPHLEMKSGGSIIVTIDLEPEWSKIVIGHLNLKPVLIAMVG